MAEDFDLTTMTLGKLVREHPEYVEQRIRVLLDERRRHQKDLKHARSALLYVARTCVENPVVAEYARNAAANLPAEGAPREEHPDGQTRRVDEDGA